MKLIDMSDYNRAAKAYWAFMVLAGSIVVGWSIKSFQHLSASQWMQFAALLSLVALASFFPIRIPSTNSSFTASDIFTFLACLILGVPAAVIVGVVDAFVSSKRTSKRLVSWIGGPAIVAVTVYLSGKAFYFVLKNYPQIALNPLG